MSHAINFDAKIKNISDETDMFTLQGLKTSFTLQKLVKDNLTESKEFHVKWMKIF